MQIGDISLTLSLYCWGFPCAMQPLLSAVELKVILSFSELYPPPWGVQMVGPDLLESSR